jgi:hypothetical protein
MMFVDDRWSEFRGLPLVPSQIRVVNALVAFIAKGQPIQPAVQETLDHAGSCRWLEVPGGHELIIPHEGGHYDKTKFTLRAKAWDHELCSGCGSRLSATTPCWVTQDGPFKVLCSTCKAALDASSGDGA